METKELNKRVYNALNNAGLVKNEYGIGNMIETGQIFCRAFSNSEIIKVIEETGLDSEVSLNGEYFSGFINGILFSVHKWV